MSLDMQREGATTGERHITGVTHKVMVRAA